MMLVPLDAKFIEFNVSVTSNFELETKMGFQVKNEVTRIGDLEDRDVKREKGSEKEQFSILFLLEI